VVPRLIDRSIGWLAPFPRCFIEIFFAFSKLFLASDLDFIIFCLCGLNNEGTIRGERDPSESALSRKDLASVFGFSTSEVALFSFF
jgi:hypothetical protein